MKEDEFNSLEIAELLKRENITIVLFKEDSHKDYYANPGYQPTKSNKQNE
jgi:hypothetical protein